MAQGSSRALPTWGKVPTGFWEHQSGYQSTVWVKATGWEHERGTGRPPPQWRGWLSEAAEWALEDSRMIWPEFLLRHRRTQVSTRKDSLPYKSYPQVGDDSTHGSRTPHSLSP